jgi:hypothetical protein
VSLTNTVRDLSAEISNCKDYQEALEVLSHIAAKLEASPVALGFWYLWPSELYEAYLDAMRMYVWKCLHE